MNIIYLKEETEVLNLEITEKTVTEEEINLLQNYKTEKIKSYEIIFKDDLIFDNVSDLTNLNPKFITKLIVKLL